MEASADTLLKLEEEKKLYKNYLVYVNQYPDNQKYIALFPVKDSEKSREQKEQILQKILKVAEVKNKIREKELLEMDKEEIENEADAEIKVEKKVKQL